MCVFTSSGSACVSRWSGCAGRVCVCVCVCVRVCTCARSCTLGVHLSVSERFCCVYTCLDVCLSISCAWMCRSESLCMWVCPRVFMPHCLYKPHCRWEAEVSEDPHRLISFPVVTAGSFAPTSPASRKPCGGVALLALTLGAEPVVLLRSSGVSVSKHLERGSSHTPDRKPFQLTDQADHREVLTPVHGEHRAFCTSGQEIPTLPG